MTLLIILFALELPRETPAAITVFILLQGVLYGFGLWWAMYLYIWYLLALLAWLCRTARHALFWAVFSGLYGLCFGGLCAAVYLFAKTPAFALSWWLSGLSYDAMHGVGNFAIMLLLYKPLRKGAAGRQAADWVLTPPMAPLPGELRPQAVKGGCPAALACGDLAGRARPAPTVLCFIGIRRAG